MKHPAFGLSVRKLCVHKTLIFAILNRPSMNPENGLLHSALGTKSIKHSVSSSKRLLAFLPNLACGGAERSIVELLGGLVELGVSVDLALADATGPVLDELHHAIAVHDL